ncbi:hypothetical protein AG1IA_10429 [Rhizoctonia solani AG-1 IA]|uniref:Uncharacterized protein n=1 Tax=Thanatephorus cucumeris (strain AG1-IA) TaxID=983506 RepID=L8WBI7_THACA|nr:hypothetical protein AG1IA_10429 [Rhizoctonia solani AG-1 IA]
MDLQASDQPKNSSKKATASGEQALESNVNNNNETQEDIEVWLVTPLATMRGNVL